MEPDNKPSNSQNSNESGIGFSKSSALQRGRNAVATGRTIAARVVRWPWRALMAMFAVDATLLSRLANFAQLVSIPIALVGTYFAFKALPPTPTASSAAPATQEVGSAVLSDATATATASAPAGGGQVETTNAASGPPAVGSASSSSADPGPEPKVIAPRVVLSRIVIDEKVSYFELMDRSLPSSSKGDYVETFDSRTEDSWVPNAKWYQLIECTEKAGKSKRKLGRCGDLHFLNPTLDILAENLTEGPTVIASLRFVVEDWNTLSGDTVDAAAVPTTAIRTSATYKYSLPAKAFEVATDGKWFIGKIQLNPPLNVVKGIPTRFNLEILYPKMDAPATTVVHLELLTTSGQKVKSKPFILFFQ